MRAARLSATLHIYLIAGLLTLAMILLQACDRRSVAERLLQATLLPEPMPLPEFLLTDQNGEQFNRDALREQWTLLFFGFTHCPDICPATLQVLATARATLASQQPGMALPRIVLISVDPERDSIDAMRQYVSYFGDGVYGATGSPDELRRLSGSLGIFFDKQAIPDGDYTISHSTAVILINRDAAFHAVLSSPIKLDTVVHDLPILMAGE